MNISGNIHSVKPITVANKTIGFNEPTFVVAEEGQASAGDLQIAKNMIRISASAGADAIEFQLAIAEDFYIRLHPGYEIYRRREFNLPDLKELFSYAAELGIIVGVSPLSSRLIPLLVKFGCPLFNVNSSDINNPDILGAIADSGCTFFVSTAMSTIEEVDWAVNYLICRGAKQFALLHGQHVMTSSSGSGVREDQTDMEVMNFFYKRYGVPVGFIDHTSNLFVPALAAARGAAVVTKHFTWDRSLNGPDWHICLEPEELAEAVRLVRLADKTRGKGIKQLADGEQADRVEMRRSIVASTYLPKGTELGPEHLQFKRPGTGLSPSLMDKVIGRRLKVPLMVDDQIQFDHLE